MTCVPPGAGKSTHSPSNAIDAACAFDLLAITLSLEVNPIRSSLCPTTRTPEGAQGQGLGPVNTSPPMQPRNEVRLVHVSHTTWP